MAERHPYASCFEDNVVNQKLALRLLPGYYRRSGRNDPRLESLERQPTTVPMDADARMDGLKPPAVR
jgi:hypothetical protein